MADVQTGLNRMGSPRPREIIYPLIPILKRALRTAECRPVIEVRPGQTRSIRFCRSLAEEPVPEEPRLVDGIRGHRRHKREIEIVVVDDRCHKGVRRCKIRDLDQQIVLDIALDVVAGCDLVLFIELVVQLERVQQLFGWLRNRRRSLGRSQGQWYRLANLFIADEPEGLVLDERPAGCESAFILMEWGSAKLCRIAEVVEEC